MHNIIYMGWLVLALALGGIDIRESSQLHTPSARYYVYPSNKTLEIEMGQIIHDTVTEFETYEELDRLVVEGTEESPEVKLGGPFFTDFEDDTIGNDPAGFTDISGVWSVQDDSGNQVLKNSGDGDILATAPAVRDNYVLKFKVKFVSGTYNRWQVNVRYIDASNRLMFGCIYSNDYIDIYEVVAGTPARLVGSAYVYGTDWHDVECVIQDGCIVVTIGTTTIKYESVSILKNSGTIFRTTSSSVNEFDDIDFVNTYHPCGKMVSDVLSLQNMDLSLSWTREQNDIHGDNFDDNEFDDQWNANMAAISGVAFEETDEELKYSGTPSGTGYVSIYTPYTGKRHSWYQEIKFKAPTAIASGKEILFRMDSDANNFIEISIQADGYRVEKVENGAQPPGSVTDPVALIGDENTTFHTLKILWDEINDRVYGWIDDYYIGALDVDTSTFPDQQRFIIHINNANGQAIDRRFDDLVLPSSQIQLLARTGPVDPADSSWEEWKPSTDNVVIDACDDATDWATSDAVNFAKSQEGTIKQEGTGSLKIVATTSAKNAYCDIDISALDLSEKSYITFWIRSDRIGKYLQMQIGESDLAGGGAEPQIYDIDIRAANTWQQEFWDLSQISEELRNSIVYACIKCISASAGFTCYLDDIKAGTYLTAYGEALPPCARDDYCQYMLVLTDGGVATPLLTELIVSTFLQSSKYLFGDAEIVEGKSKYLFGSPNIVERTAKYLLADAEIVNGFSQYIIVNPNMVKGNGVYLYVVPTIVSRIPKPSYGRMFQRLTSVKKEVS